MVHAERCQVLTTGAGPIGTKMAALFGRAGVKVRVLDAVDDCAADMLTTAR